MADAERATLVMDAGLGRRLKRAAAAMGTTLYTVLSSAWLVVLHRWADQEDVTLGIPSFGRSFGRDDRMVGHCVDVLPLRSRLEGDPTFAAFTAGVHASMMEAYEHQACTYSSLAPSLRSAPGEPPLVSVTFNLEPGGTGGSGAGFAGLHVSRADRPHLFTKFDMGVDVVDAGGELRVSCKYNRHLLDAASMARVLESFRTLLERAADDAARPLSRLPLLEGAEREKMIRAGRGVRGACPQACLHTLFEECARRTPELPAVVAGGREVSYAALDAAADRFARHLRGLGVGLEARVALCLERSPELVVAMLGTLKAGAAYVPLDPDYPAERLAFLLRDSGAGVVATTGALAGRLPAGAARVVRMDEPLPADGAGGEPVPVGPDHLAYVTYTSGSTGTPKGVAVAHRGVVNLVAEFQRMQPVEPGDACAAWSSIGFDVSVYEIFTALCFGGTLHLAAGDARELAPRLPRWLGEAGIRSAYVAPAMVDDLAAYVAAHPGALSLRRLLVGVEPLRETVLAAIARGV
ncbi:MAG TPA: AMP-binding protein, partial [Longimicrobium sp.]